jgi:hypothetical protein
MILEFPFQRLKTVAKPMTVEQQASLIKCQNAEITKLKQRLNQKLTKNNKWR